MQCDSRAVTAPGRRLLAATASQQLPDIHGHGVICTPTYHRGTLSRDSLEEPATNFG
jgi:hypothetical protein